MANGLAQLAAQKAPQAVAAIGALVFQSKHGSGKKNFDMAMGQNLWYHIWVDEHPFTSYFDVHQGYRVLTHNHMHRYTKNRILVDIMGYNGIIDVQLMI